MLVQHTQMWEEERPVGPGTSYHPIQLYEKSINMVKPTSPPFLCFIRFCLEMAVRSREVKDKDVCRACASMLQKEFMYQPSLPISLSTNLSKEISLPQCSVTLEYIHSAKWQCAKVILRSWRYTYSCCTPSGTSECPTVMHVLPHSSSDPWHSYGALCL